MKEGLKAGSPYKKKEKKKRKRKRKPLFLLNIWCPPNTPRNFLECFMRQLTLEVGFGHNVQNPSGWQ